MTDKITDRLQCHGGLELRKFWQTVLTKHCFNEKQEKRAIAAVEEPENRDVETDEDTCCFPTFCEE